MDERKPEDKVNPVKYIQKGFWVWFGFLGAAVSVLVGISVLYWIAGLVLSYHAYMSAKPQRDWDECWFKESRIYHKRVDDLSGTNEKFIGSMSMKEAGLGFERRQAVMKRMKLPSVICKEKGLKAFGRYYKTLNGEYKVE